MGRVSARESVICVIIVISFLSTNAIPSEFEETSKDGSSLTVADGPRHGKDLSNSGSIEEVQAILPVQVDTGTLVSGFNDHIDGMRENMINLDEKLEIVKANEARVEEENARLIEQLKKSKENEALLIEQLRVSKENEAKARHTSKAEGGSSDEQSFATAAAGFTWKGILGGCVNSSDVDDWTLLLHNQNLWDRTRSKEQKEVWARVYSMGPFQNNWEEYKNGFEYQHSLKGLSDAYWYGLDRMHRQTSIGRWQLVLSYVCSKSKSKSYVSYEPLGRWTAENLTTFAFRTIILKWGGKIHFISFTSDPS